MWDNATIMMLVKETGTTLFITLTSTVFAYALGLPLGILLVVTAKDGLRPNAAVYKILNAVVYKVLDALVNVVRSVPFLILLMLLIPFTRLVVGKSDDCPADHSGGSFYCPFGGIFPVGSGQRGD